MSGGGKGGSSLARGAATDSARQARLAHARRSLVALGACALLLAASMYSVGGSSASYWVAVAGLVLITGATMRSSGFPLAFYGITSLGARGSLRSAILSTAVLAAAGIGFLVLISGTRSWNMLPGLFTPDHDLELAAYVLLAAPFEELLFRGVFQSSARHILGDGPRAAVAAILISTLAFAASHLPWGLPTSLVMLVPGIVWGIQFERDRTLIGVMLSHAVIGYLFVGATPFWKLITGAA